MAEIKITVSAENRTHEALHVMEQDVQSFFSTLGSAVLEAGSRLGGLEKELLALDSLLGKERVFTINTADAASSLQELAGLRSRIDSTPSDYGEVPYPLGEGVLDSYASGTDYVPRTGLYRLHEGEKVIPAHPASSPSSTSIWSVSFSPGSIVINGADRNARDLARELAPEIREELERINRRR